MAFEMIPRVYFLFANNVTVDCIYVGVNESVLVLRVPFKTVMFKNAKCHRNLIYNEENWWIFFMYCKKKKFLCFYFIKVKYQYSIITFSNLFDT